MDTIFLPKYATLTIGYFEVHLYDTCEVKWGSEFEEFLIEYGSIFLYDYKILLDREKVQPQNYQTLLRQKKAINSINEAIQFAI